MVRGDVGDEWPFRAPPRSATTVPSWNIDTLLPTPPPSRIYVKSNLQKGPNRLGVLAFKLVTCNDELDEECTVADLKTRIYDRLMLAPNQAVHLTSWGRPLPDDKMLVDLAVPTNGRIEMKLGYQVPDPNRGLERLYVTSTCISTRRVQADARTTVLDLKLSLQQCLMKGEHEWWEADGTCVKMSGTTLLGAANSPADPKQGTDEVLLGEELMIEEKLHLQASWRPRLVAHRHLRLHALRLREPHPPATTSQTPRPRRPQGGKGAVTMRRMGPDRVGNRVTDGELEKDVLLRAGARPRGPALAQAPHASPPSPRAQHCLSFTRCVCVPRG